MCAQERERAAARAKEDAENDAFAARLAAMENRRNLFLDDTSSFLTDLQSSSERRDVRTDGHEMAAVISGFQVRGSGPEFRLSVPKTCTKA